MALPWLKLQGEVTIGFVQVAITASLKQTRLLHDPAVSTTAMPLTRFNKKQTIKSTSKSPKQTVQHVVRTSRLTSLCFTFHSVKLRWTSMRFLWCCRPAVKLLITWSLRWIDCSYVASNSRNASKSFWSLVPSPMCLHSDNPITTRSLWRVTVNTIMNKKYQV